MMKQEAMARERSAILLVEDDANDVALIRRAFHKAGIANPLIVVGDGDAAVSYLAGEGEHADRKRYPVPMLVLLDLKLPRRSGHEVLVWLRAQEGLRRMPVGVLSSSVDSADVCQAYDLGVNSYLVKPVSFEALEELMRTFSLYWIRHNLSASLAEGL